jgi:oxygen-independent coproporphyrinogen-3 oxidase
MGRRHTADDIFKKYELAKKFGFDVNMDFIAGLIGENFETFKSTIKTAISLDPEDITVHTLALKHGSRLKESISRLSDGSAREFVDFAHDELYKAGYRPYYLYRQKYMADNLENTGYAKPGKECVYNIDIMEEISQIIACGANAVSKRVFGEKNRIERLGAPKDIATYIQKVETVLSKKFELYGLPPTKK